MSMAKTSLQAWRLQRRQALRQRILMPPPPPLGRLYWRPSILPARPLVTRGYVLWRWLMQHGVPLGAILGGVGVLCLLAMIAYTGLSHVSPVPDAVVVGPAPVPAPPAERPSVPDTHAGELPDHLVPSSRHISSMLTGVSLIIGLIGLAGFLLSITDNWFFHIAMPDVPFFTTAAVLGLGGLLLSLLLYL